ncbi:HinT-interacting membrane complex lipoprotein P60 [[Mycoplasma] mobile]|uniref:Lipoprotein P60 homolog n=1 Tax=Mycoplasma mobile (strain ATCC 43663 / 163K / NCTC 11711) TaxID=267748 RepID=Q6KIK0_MYCM1|nr:hypothetical protein [[Mycoplasma] mobile]AAT27576.1 lipoprotein P60 homolog [Mycoplasma mobile 163K]
MKKRLLLSIATPAILSTSLVVVACSTNVQDINVSASLTTEQARAAVLQTWVNGILNANLNVEFPKTTNEPSIDVQNAFKGTWNDAETVFTFSNNSSAFINFRNDAVSAWNFYQAIQIQQNKSFWIEFKSNTLERNGISIIDFNPERDKTLPLAGFINNNSYSKSDLNFLGTNIFVQMYNINQSTISNTINQMILAKHYFSKQTENNIKNGTDYNTVIGASGTSNAKTILESIDVSNPNFLLIKYLLENQVSERWEFNQTQNTNNFLNTNINTIEGENGFNALFRNNNIALNTKQKLESLIGLNDNINWNISANNLPNITTSSNSSSNIVNYRGFSFQNTGAPIINYDIATLRAATRIESGFVHITKTNNIYSLNELMRNNIVKFYLEEAATQVQNLNISLNNNQITDVSLLKEDNFTLSENAGSVFNFKLNRVSRIVNTSSIDLNVKLDLNLARANLSNDVRRILENSSILNSLRELNFNIRLNTKSSETNSIINQISLDNSVFSDNLNLKYGGLLSETNILSLINDDLVTSVPINVTASSATLTYFNKVVPLFNVNSSRFTFINTPWAETIDNNRAIVKENLYYSLFTQNRTSIFNQMKTFYVKLGNVLEINNNQALLDAARTEGILKL